MNDGFSPREAVEPTSRVDLPRLRLIHLFAWTTAVAIAFLPDVLAQEPVVATSSPTVTEAQRAAADTAGVAFGVLQGSYLFVTASLYYWRKRGLFARRQPGHILALQGTACWATSLATQALLAIVSQRTDSFLLTLYSLPQLVLGLVFAVWFLKIAAKRGGSTQWRWAFGVLALAPIFAWSFLFFGMVASRPLGSSTSMTWFVIPQVAAPAAQFLALACAMACDRRTRRERHWTHRLGAGARLLEAVTTIGIYAWAARLLDA